MVEAIPLQLLGLVAQQLCRRARGSVRPKAFRDIIMHARSTDRRKRGSNALQFGAIGRPKRKRGGREAEDVDVLSFKIPKRWRQLRAL